MSEKSLYNWYHKKYEIEERYIKYQLAAFVIVLFAELFIASYLQQYGNLAPSEQMLPAIMLIIAQVLNFVMLYLHYDANPEYVEEE